MRFAVTRARRSSSGVLSLGSASRAKSAPVSVPPSTVSRGIEKTIAPISTTSPSGGAPVSARAASPATTAASAINMKRDGMNLTRA